MSGPASFAVRAARAAVACAATAVLASGLYGARGAMASGEPAADLRRLEALERELLLLVQGEAQPVDASPALCAAAGKPVPSGVERGTAEWYAGSAPCEVRYSPSATALVTTASRGISKRLYESPGVRAELDRILDSLIAAIDGVALPPARKLRVHSTAWELAIALGSRLDSHPEWVEPLRSTRCRSFELLDRTRFSPAEIAGLPATLADLPELAGAPEVSGTVAAIVRRDPAVVEVFPATDFHAATFGGRFSPRIFLTLSREPERLLAFLDRERDQQALIELPLRFDGLEAVLVLYFNALTEDGTIVPTEHVAMLHRYEFSARTSFDYEFERASELLEFTTIEYERTYGDRSSGAAQDATSGFAHRRRDPEGISLLIMVDAKPGVPGVPATTLRGHCLKCHVYRVETFNTHSRVPRDFAIPFTHPLADVGAGHVAGDIEDRIRKGLESCGLGEPSAPSAADRGAASEEP